MLWKIIQGRPINFKVWMKCYMHEARPKKEGSTAGWWRPLLSTPDRQVVIQAATLQIRHKSLLLQHNSTSYNCYCAKSSPIGMVGMLWWSISYANRRVDGRNSRKTAGFAGYLRTVLLSSHDPDASYLQVTSWQPLVGLRWIVKS